MNRHDVVILGGGLTGAAMALLLRRRLPDCSVLVLEARRDFSPACLPSAELASLFLTRGLRLWDHLAREELPHYGPRFFFHNDEVLRVQDATELGARAVPSLPAFLLREDVLCEHLHAEARAAGATLLRGATVRELDLRPWDSGVAWDGAAGGSDGGETRATWVLDASGRGALLGRRLDLVAPLKEHPVAAITGRWRGDLDLDGPRFDPETGFGRATLVARRLCSNHFQGYGYRVSFLALGDGEMSVTVAYDKRVLDLHAQGPIADVYTAFLSGLPATRQLLQNAELLGDDLRFLPQVAFAASRRVGEGWALLGSAAGFLDPVGAPGMDFAARSVESTARIVQERAAGRPVAALLEAENRDFRASVARTLDARCRDRYLVDGDWELFWPSFLLDRGLYLLGEVLPALGDYAGSMERLPMTGAMGALRARFMRFYARRFLRLARTRMWTGHYGRSNCGRRLHYELGLGGSAVLCVVHGLAGWIVRELDQLGLEWTRVLRRARGDHRLGEGRDLVTLPEGVGILADAGTEQP